MTGNIRLGQMFIIYLVVFFLLGASGAFAQISIIHTTPSPVVAGDFADLTVQIRGGVPVTRDMNQNVTFALKETEFIKPLSNQELVVFELFDGQVLTRTFRVFIPNTVPRGGIPVFLREIREGITLEHRDFLQVEGGVVPSELRIGSVRSVPNRMIADSRDVAVFVTVQNIGDRSAELIVARLKNEFIEESYFQSTQSSISRIEGGEEVEIRFDFDITQTQQRVLPGSIHFDFRERNPVTNVFERRSQELDFSLTLARTPQFEFVSQDPVTPMRVGSSNQQLELRLTNLGDVQGDSVRIRLFPDPSAPFDFDKTTYFVSPIMEVGDEKKVVISFDILRSALVQEYSVRAEIESFVGTNRYVQREQIVIPVLEEASSTIGQNALLLIGVLFGLAIVIGILYKRRKEDD